MSDISLTASMRSNLLSLQKTQSLMDTTQERLSTGKKVNSALDNPSSYYTAQSLNNRAGDLSALLDSMGQGVQTIKAADEAISSITSLVQQAKAIANQAMDSAITKIESVGHFENMTVAQGLSFDIEGAVGQVRVAIETSEARTITIEEMAERIEAELNKAVDKDGKVIGDFEVEINSDKNGFKIISGSGRATKVKTDNTSDLPFFGLTFTGTAGSADRLKQQERYNDVLTQIDQLAKDASYKGVNLLQNNDLTVIFNEDRSSSITIKGVDASTNGLNILKTDRWGSDTNISVSLSQVEAAINTLRAMSSEFGNNYSIVQTREEFTENLINVLTEGADKLTLADMNEESANMLALQTRQQLAINSLSLASSAAQSVLRLF